MKAITVTKQNSGSENFQEIELEKPEAFGHDILVRVEAIAVNPVDIKIRSSQKNNDSLPRILGWDTSGVIEAIGNNVSLFKPGDEVYYAGDITRQGSNSEFHLVDERIVGRKPSSLSFAEAAALPLTSITAYEGLFDRLKIDKNGKNSGESILIIGGAGGVGSIAIQLAKLAGLKVIATASRDESIAWVKKYGADYVINHHLPLIPQLKTLELNFVDHIAIFNNTDNHWKDVSKLIRPQGNILAIVENTYPLDMSTLKSKSSSLTWEFMFTRSMFKTEDMIKQHHLLNEISDYIDNRQLKTTLNKTLSPINVDNLQKAHIMIEDGTSTGKITITKSMQLTY